MDQNDAAGNAPAEPLAPAPADAAAPTPPPAPSGGALLKAARERQGVHIAALAASIKVSPRKLEALEADRWDELPDATFTRALAQAVCRSLKIDSRPVLDLLPSGGPARLEPPGTHLNTPLRQRASRDEAVWIAPVMRPWLAGAAVLVLAAVAVMFVPASWWRGGETRLQASAASAPQEVKAPVEPASSNLAAELAASAPAGPASSPVVPASGPLPGEPMAASQVVPATVSATAPVPAPVNVFEGASGLLQIYAARDAWVGVRDAKGNQIVSRQMAAGERLVVEGETPLKLTVGNASGVEMRFRGHVVDLLPHVRDNVARLDLP